MFDFFKNENANQVVERQVAAVDTFIGGTEFQVNTYTTNLQADSCASGLVDGGFVVIWDSRSQDGDQDGIYGKHYNSAGIPQGAEFQVNIFTTNTQAYSSVTGLTDGGFLVTWSSYGQDATATFGIYGQRYDNASSPLGTEFKINTYTTSNQMNSCTVTLVNGEFLIIWFGLGQEGSGADIYGQRYDNGGVALGTEFRVNTYTTNAQEYPSVAALADGGFVVIWESYNAQDGDGIGIYGQRYDSLGLLQDSEFQVNTYTTGDQYQLAVASLKEGGFVVTWVSYQDGDQGGIYGQRYNNVGNRQSAEFQVNSYFTGHQYHPKNTGLTDGGYLIVWSSNGQDGSGEGIYGQRYDSYGVAKDNEFLVNTYITDSQGNPSVEALKDGSFVVTWESRGGQDGDGYGIYAKIFTPVASPSPTPSPRLNNSNILFIALGLGVATFASLGALAYAKYRSKKFSDAEKLDAGMAQALNPTLRSAKTNALTPSELLMSVDEIIPEQAISDLSAAMSEEVRLSEILVQAEEKTSPATSAIGKIEILTPSDKVESDQAISPLRQYDDLPVAVLNTIKTPRVEECRLPSGSVDSRLHASYLIPYNQLTFGKILGQGAYGVVYEGLWENDKVAIKQLLATKLTDAALKDFLKEAEVMSNLHHDRVIRLNGVSIDNPGHYSMVMELMPHGSLFDLLQNNQPLAWDVRYTIANDISAGLGYLHHRDILHRDLKSLNVLIGYGMRAKLTDFGMAKIKSQTRSTKTLADGKVKGTIAWMAPEQFKRDSTASKASDIYSYGMVLWELVTRKIPFENAPNTEVLTAWVKDAEQEKIPEDCPPQFAKLIKWCWEKEPVARPTADQAAEELKSDEGLQAEIPDAEPNYHANLNTQFGL